MDDPSQYLTNVHKLDKYPTIPFAVYRSVEDTIDGVENEGVHSAFQGDDQGLAPSHGQPIKDLKRAERWLRNRSFLVAHHRGNRELWLFQKGGNIAKPQTDQDTDQDVGPEELTPPDGIALRRILQGVFHSSSLDKKGQSSTRAPATAPLHTGSEQASRGTQGLHSSGIQASTATNAPSMPAPSSTHGHVEPQRRRQLDSSDIYSLFITAVISMISFQLSRDHGYIPLSSRILLAPSSIPSVSSHGRSERASLIITSLDARLTTLGTLILSLTPRPDLDLDLVSRNPLPLRNAKYSVLLLAPGGRLAYFLGSDGEDETEQALGEDISSEQGRREARSRLAHKEQERSAKCSAQRWLEQRGIVLANLDDDANWIKVEVPAEGEGTGSNQNEDVLPLVIWWPAALSFYKSKDVEILLSAEENSQHAAKPDLETFQIPEQDPLSFVEEWFQKKGERHDLTESRCIAREAEKKRSVGEATVGRDQTATIDAIPRANNYGDLQAASRVYPTPPDGLHVPGVQGINFQDGNASIVAGNAESHPPKSDTDVDMAGLDDSKTSEKINAEGQDIKMPDLGMSAGNIDTSGDDDLFGDMDFDRFTENGVTEADFSFFDEPDFGDMDDSTAVQANTDVKDQDVQANNENLVPTHKDSSPSNQVKQPSSSSAKRQVSQDLDTDLLPGPAMTTPATEERAPVREEGPETGLTIKDQISSEEDEENKAQESPPLSPDRIFQKLFPHLSSPGAQRQMLPPTGNNSPVLERHSRRRSIFDAVSFDQNFGQFDKKYGSQGRFGFESIAPNTGKKSNEVSSPHPTSIPNIGLPKPKKKTRSITNIESPSHKMTAAEALEALPEKGEDDEDDDLGSEDDDSDDFTSSISGQDDTSISTETCTPTLAPHSGTKRKRHWDGGDESVASSMQRLAFDKDSEDENLRTYLPSEFDFLDSDSTSWPWKSDIPFALNEQDKTIELNNKDFMAVAQLVADQVVSSTLDPLDRFSGRREMGNIAPTRDCFQDAFTQVINDEFPEAEQCDLASYAAVQDIPPEPPIIGRAPLRAIARRAVPGSTNTDVSTSNRKSSIFELPPPHVRVKRADMPLEVLPPALPFWETLGFEPVSGPKGVYAYCVFPSTEGLVHAVDGFLDRIASSFDAYKLGSHKRGLRSNGDPDGLVPFVVPEEASSETVLQSVRSACISLGQTLPNVPMENRNIVIYIVNPFQHAESIVDLCSAFLDLFQAYIHSPEFQQLRRLNEIVLQVVPIDFIASTTSLPLPSESEYTKLALEVYDRCAPAEISEGSGNSNTDGPPQQGASIILGHEPPKTIDLRLTTEPSSSALHDNACIHLAYAQSADGRWISAAWTDSLGRYQTLVSYCLKRRGSVERPLKEVMKEIWETTMQIVQTRRAGWRLFIAKVGIMERAEIETWTELAATTTPQHSLSLTLLTIDTSPPLILYPRPTSLSPLMTAQTLKPSDPTTPTANRHNISSPADVSVSTPAATPVPQPATPSTTATGQDASGAADSNAAETTLVDITDLTFAVVLAHKPSALGIPTVYAPTLASGYLLRHSASAFSSPSSTSTYTTATTTAANANAAANPIDLSPWTILGVNIVLAPPRNGTGSSSVSSATTSTHDTLLREVLRMYRDLAVLGRFRAAGGTGGGGGGLHHPSSSSLAATRSSSSSSSSNVPDGIRPWHIAVAACAADTLGRVM
ncbi:MAG: hypothetical protein M1819_003371 [Sarea resinae]|nr:MAG: hypothetical protein M1819_003371 [Sarea resinae]